jgi:hypothetical protein
MLLKKKQALKLETPMALQKQKRLKTTNNRPALLIFKKPRILLLGHAVFFIISSKETNQF